MTPGEVTQMLLAVARREGPFTHLSADRGGATAWGITQGTIAHWRGRPVTEAEVQALPLDEAVEIYRTQYYLAPGLSHLLDTLQPFMLDFAVNSGPGRAIQALQECLALTPDGVLGPVTLAASAAAPPTLLTRLIAWRLMMIARIVRRDPSQVIFLSGWLSRTLSFLPGAA